MIAAYEPNALRPSNFSPFTRVRYLHIYSDFLLLNGHTDHFNLNFNAITILQRTLLRRFTTIHRVNMPLVVPGIQSKDGNDDWATKLMGKSIGDNHNETVRSLSQTQSMGACLLYPFQCSCQSCNTSRHF